ncbi:MAG: glycosyltransferase family 4 protein [Anaerolineales bacterium]
MRKLRLARVITRLNVGGPATHVVQLASRLPPSEFETLLITGREGPGEASMLYLAERAGVTPLVIPELTPVLAGQDLIALSKLVRTFQHWRPDIVHTHTAKAGTLGRLAARLTGVPAVVHTFHGHVLRGYFPRPVEELFRMVERGMALLTDRIVTLSPSLRSDLIGMKIAAASKIEVIPLGIDFSQLVERERRRGYLRQVLGIENPYPIIGTVGRLVSIKNHTMFLRAARSMVNSGIQASFVIVGDGELRPSLEAQARSMDLAGRIFFLGWREEMSAIYLDLDIFALTSNNEGTPLSLIEAMAAGLPVVATAVGGVPDVVTDQRNGFLVPADDSAALAETWRTILKDPERSKQIGEQARLDAVRRFGLERMLEQTRELYRSLAGRRIGAR